MLAGCLVAAVMMIGSYHLATSWWAPQLMPLLAADREQLVDEWSAGYGIAEAVEVIAAQAEKTAPLVLTEGYFGTLPDGLQVYFFNHDLVNRVRIEGIGQPIYYLEKASDWLPLYDQALLVVNSHRFFIDPVEAGLTLMAEYARPDPGAPRLQVWRIK